MKERADIQPLLRADISVLSDDLMGIAEEFSDWADSQRRIDLLCMDNEADLVVVELKTHRRWRAERPIAVINLNCDKHAFEQEWTAC